MSKRTNRELFYDFIEALKEVEEAIGGDPGGRITLDSLDEVADRHKVSAIDLLIVIRSGGQMRLNLADGCLAQRYTRRKRTNKGR